MKDEVETRQCNDCGEEFIDSGEFICPFCTSKNVRIVEDEKPTGDSEHG